MDIFKISRTQAYAGASLPVRVVKAFEDEFAQDLIKLWVEK